MTRSDLAMYGGKPAVPAALRKVQWPLVTDADVAGVVGALTSGKFTVGSSGETEITNLERDWSAFVGTRHAISVNNATSGLGLATMAVGIQPGDEVLVPALSFVASAFGPLYQLGIPVFVDIDPATFNIDPDRLEERITPRTRAIVVVHLHGLPADMDRINDVARRHDLAVIEDAAQSLGASYRGRPTGSLGRIGVFSLNAEKSVPTCGEAGVLTTEDDRIAQLCRSGRALGEDWVDGPRRYISQRLGWNHKPSSVLAAFARSQLARYPDYQPARDRNVAALLDVAAQLPGVVVPETPPDRTHVWHMIRFRFDPERAGLTGVAPGPFRQAVARALRAEGMTLSHYQMMPLPGQPAFQSRDGFGNGYPWTLPGVAPQRYDMTDYPQTLAVIEDSLVVRRVHLNPDSGPLLQAYGDALCKVWDNLDVIAKLATALPYEPPWVGALTDSAS
jgi:perosamine synthetase